MSAIESIVVPEETVSGRFARFHAIKWWDQALLRDARVLLVGAGALGNEVLKNLALLGVGNVVVADMDRVEETNLSRSVLFRAKDQGRPKVDAIADAARDIYPEMRIVPLNGNVLSDVGLGYFRWAQVVVGALDNREARVYVNQACAQVGTPWIDGGIDILNGIVRGFDPQKGACYECTMGQADWDLLAKRRSCSLLARRAAMEGGAPTTPTTASAVGAIQAQEVVKRLHGLESLSGRGFVFEGLTHHSFTVDYPVVADCPWHTPPAQVLQAQDIGSDTPLQAIWDRCASELGGLDAIDFSREVIETLECPSCKVSMQVRKSAESISEDDAVCGVCGSDRVPRFLHSLGEGAPALALTPSQVGLPHWDIVWGRFGERVVGVEFSADRKQPLNG